MANGLHIQLLGKFCLTYNGVRVANLHSPRLRSLLAYLIVHGDAPQPRQHLAFLLWPDSTEEQARTNLRNLVHLLRQALPHTECCLHCEGQVLVWEPHVPYVLDTTEFETAIAAGAFGRAVELYRGDLLPDCYADWVAPERERLRGHYLTALQGLAEQAEAARDVEGALQWAQRLAREDLFNEGYCVRLMRLQDLAGDRAAALRTYRAFAAALQREIGADPAPSTQQIYTQLLHGAVAGWLTGPAIKSFPLAGRQREWRLLISAWRLAAGGQPQLVLLLGEAGAGKTRLAEDLLAWVGRQNYPCALARCYAAEGTLPYGPVVTWLRSRPLPDLAAPWRREIARIMPDVSPGTRRRHADCERHLLFEALAHAVLGWGEPAAGANAHMRAGAPSEPAPILLVLDDMPWCDRDTLEWLHFLLRPERKSPLLVVGAARSEDIAANQPLALVIASLRRHQLLTEIDLGPPGRAGS